MEDIVINNQLGNVIQSTAQVLEDAIDTKNNVKIDYSQIIIKDISDTSAILSAKTDSKDYKGDIGVNFKIQIGLDQLEYQYNEGGATTILGFAPGFVPSYGTNIVVSTSLYHSEGWHIADNAFYGCDALKSIILTPTHYDSFANIGSYAFYNCSNLELVTIGCDDDGRNWTYATGSYAFYGCQKLYSSNDYLLVDDGDFNDNTQHTIGEHAFENIGATTFICIIAIRQEQQLYYRMIIVLLIVAI